LSNKLVAICLNLNINYFTLDIDSTIITRYGEQEGAKIAQRPNATGRTLSLFPEDEIHRN